MEINNPAVLAEVTALFQAFGQDFATASTTFSRNGRIGRQQQSWARLPEGWRVVAAQVSLMPEGWTG